MVEETSIWELRKGLPQTVLPLCDDMLSYGERLIINHFQDGSREGGQDEEDKIVKNIIEESKLRLTSSGILLDEQNLDLLVRSIESDAGMMFTMAKEAYFRDGPLSPY